MLVCYQKVSYHHLNLKYSFKGQQLGVHMGEPPGERRYIQIMTSIVLM